MRVICGVVLSALVAASPAIAGMPAKQNAPEGWAAWETYSRSLIPRLFPAQAAYLKHQPISVIDRPEPNLTTIGPLILINFGYIEFVRDEAEYAAGLAHELGHLNRGHLGVPLMANGVPAPHDMELVRIQELEADQDALIALRRAGYDACALTRTITRLVDLQGHRRGPSNELNALNLLREKVLKQTCSVR